MNNLRSRFLIPVLVVNNVATVVRYSGSNPVSSRVMQSREMIKEQLRKMRREQNKRTPCYLRVRRSEYKCLAYQEMSSPSCVPQPCPEPLDAKKYAPSDKESRDYQKTWCDFKPATMERRMPKFRKIYPNRARRNPRQCKGKLCTACQPKDCELPETGRAPPERLFPPRTKPWECCKMCVPSCRPRRASVKCPRLPTMPLCCVKRKTQFPSFSECKKFELSPPIAACECDQKPSICDLWNFWRTKR